MLPFTRLNPRCTPDALGFIPAFLSDYDPRTAIEQLDANYQHGGGWRPVSGFLPLADFMLLQYPGDAPIYALASADLHGAERVIIYEHAFVCVIKGDGTYEVARMD